MATPVSANNRGAFIALIDRLIGGGIPRDNELHLFSVYDSIDDDERRWTPIFYAIAGMNYTAVEQMLARTADINHYSPLLAYHSYDFGHSPIHYAAQIGRCSVLRRMSRYWTVDDLQQTDNGDRTPLEVAVYYGRLPATRLFLSEIRRFSLLFLQPENVIQDSLNSALGFALFPYRSRRSSILRLRPLVRYLVQQGASFENEVFGMPLMISVMMTYPINATRQVVSSTTVVALMIRNGADVNVRDANGGGTPLATAIGVTGMINVPLVRLLLENGADVNVLTDLGYSLLGVAIQSGNQSLVDLLRRHGAELSGTQRQLRLDFLD